MDIDSIASAPYQVPYTQGRVERAWPDTRQELYWTDSVDYSQPIIRVLPCAWNNPGEKNQ